MLISEVCKRFDMSADTLRYYERIGLIPKVHRTEGGMRDYTDYDCGWIDFIKCMRNAGVQIEALTEYVKLFGEGDKTHEERKQILVRERDRISEQIDELQSTLMRLNGKIEKYDTVFRDAEDELKLPNNK